MLGMPVSFYMMPVLCVQLSLPEVFTHLYWTVLVIRLPVLVSPPRSAGIFIGEPDSISGGVYR